MAQETMVVFNLANLRRQLALQLGREIPWREISEWTGLSEATLINMARNNSRQVHVETLRKLLEYFRAHGMPIAVGDLFREEAA